jgi:glycosyltransferase involved in cell wall biosynthesis
MKIAIDARMLKEVPDDGISRFTFETINHLVSSYPDHQYVLIADVRYKTPPLVAGNLIWKYTFPKARRPFQWYFRTEIQVTRLLREINPDVYLSPDGIIPLRSSVRSVPVIHDISFIHRPSDIPAPERFFYRNFFPQYASEGARILTVSEFCRNDIAENLKIDIGKIDVAWNGVSDYFSPIASDEAIGFREKLTGGAPYFLFVSNFSPRKNIPGLIKAYEQYRANNVENAKLVLAGGRLFLNSETDKLLKASPFRNDIILTGPVLHSDLRSYYGAALALVFVPWFEGFGIPAAEAMRCGTPVILSDTSSLPEVGGEAALYAKPGNISEIADAMHRVASDGELRKSMIKKGLPQSEKFTWKNTSDCVMKSLLKV